MGQVITDVGIDLDGVIYPFANAFKQYCCERMGRLFLPDPTHWNFYEDWDLDEKTFNQWLNDAANTHSVFATEEPYEGVVEAWKELREMGMKIHVITARPQSSWEQTAGWLTNHGLIADSLHFNTTKAFLSRIAKGKAILVDDHVAYYDEAECNNILPVLMDRPWNQDKKDAIRVSNLLNFVSLVRGYNLVAKTEKPQPKRYQYEAEPYKGIYQKPFPKKSPHDPNEPHPMWKNY